MPPGVYVRDATEGIFCVEDLPKPQIIKRSRNFLHQSCSRCGRSATRLRTAQRTLHELGDPIRNRPRDLQVTYSQHYCSRCDHYFNADMLDLAVPNGHYTHRVVATAVRCVVEDGLAYRTASWHLWRDHRVFVPFATIQNWVEAAGKKSLRQVEQEYLDDALAKFSGYLAMDELYDGPFCVLSIVDNRTYRRLAYRVLDKSPQARDISRFLKAFRKQLDSRGLSVAGITTDASPLYPKPLALVFNGVPHQICCFHIIKELTLAVLRAVAKVRKQLNAKLPSLPKGRPRKGQRRQTRRKQRQKQRINELFEHRHLFVTHHLTSAQRQTLQRITRGLPQLRVLREIMDEVYRLFDRRCRSDTALEKLARLRRRVKRFKQVGKTLAKLYSPNLEKALTFLDDKQLPSTSNAVERGNRRHRKMQKSIYRVRTKASLEHRMAMDLKREMQFTGRDQTTRSLHRARSPRRFGPENPVESVTLL